MKTVIIYNTTQILLTKNSNHDTDDTTMMYIIASSSRIISIKYYHQYQINKQIFLKLQESMIRIASITMVIVTSNNNIYYSSSYLLKINLVSYYGLQYYVLLLLLLVVVATTITITVMMVYIYIISYSNQHKFCCIPSNVIKFNLRLQLQQLRGKRGAQKFLHLV